MWWEIGWDSWVFGLGGLVVGLAGLGIGIGAWVYAARANRSATSAVEAVENFEKSFADQMDAERLVRNTPPVVSPPAALVAVNDGRGNCSIVNEGEGAAFGVWVEPATVFTEIHSRDRWETIEAGAEVEVSLLSTSSSTPPALHIYWREDASGEEKTRELTFRVSRR